MTSKILFLSIDGMTDPLGQSQVMPYLAGLASRGFSITILSCEKKENFLARQKNVTDLLKQAGISWKYCFYSKKIPLISQRGNLQKLKTLAIKEAKSSTGNLIVHCRSYLPALVGLHLKKKFGARFIFDMRGFWADERVEGGVWKLSNPIHKSAYTYFKRKEKELLAAADHIITLSHNAKTILEKWAQNEKPAIEVIPCCADLDHFQISGHEQKIAFRRQLLMAPDTFVLGYLGSLGTWYMLDEMLDFFKEFNAHHKNSLLFFVTPDKPEAILKAAQKKNIPLKQVLVKSAQRNEVPGYISTFNAGLFFIRPTFSKKGSSPTKMAEILACGIPVITNSGIGDCDEVITESGCGITLNGFTIKDYQNTISRIDELARLKPEYLRAVAEKYFSLQKGIDSYEKVYRNLGGS